MVRHLEDLLDEVNGYVEAKAPEIDAIQRQNDDLVVKVQDANEKIEIGNARMRETKEKLNSESHTRRQMEASVSSLRLQLQEQVNQTSVLLHEVELLKGGAGMKRRRSSTSSSSIEGATPTEGSTPSFMTVAELVSQNTSLKASVARLRNECEIEAQKELAQLREDWQKMDEAYKELAKARETDRSTYEGLLSRADKEKKEMMQQIEELRKSLQDTASAATQADGTGDAGAGSGSSPSRGSSSAERKISLLQDKLETVKTESQKQLGLIGQESASLREENRKLSTESIRLKTMLQLEKDRKSVISEAMSELRASLKRVEDDARTTEKRSAALAAQNATLEGTVKTVVHERSIALREKSEAMEKMHSAQARVEVFSEQLQAVLGEKAKIASLLVETQQRVSEETQSAREMAREQTEKVLREMEELKNNLVFYRSAYEEQSSTLISSKESIKRLEEESSKFADERHSWSVEKQSLIDKIKLYKGRASIGYPSPPPPAAAAAESSATPSASSGGGPQLERMLNVARAEVESQKSSNESFPFPPSFRDTLSQKSVMRAWFMEFRVQGLGIFVLQTAVKSMEERIKSSDEKVAKLTADLKAKTAELTAARASVQNAEKKIQEFESKGGLARSDAEALREKIHNLEEDLKQAKSEIDLANAKAVEAGNALKDVKQEYTREFIKRGKEAEALVAARQERERAVDEMKKDIEQLDKKLKEKDEAHAETKRQLSAAEEMVKQSEQRIKALGEENEKYQTLFTSSSSSSSASTASGKEAKESAATAPSSTNEVGKLKALLQQVNESKKLLIAREQEALLECSRHKARSLGLEKDLNRLEERLRQQEDHIERMREAEEKYSLLTAKVQELSMYESEYQRLKMDLETQRQNLQKTQSELDAAKEESSKLKAQLNESTERFRHQSTAMKATAAKAERFEKLHAELTKKYANMEPAEVAKLKENEGKLKAELAQVHAQLKEKSAKVESLQSASKALQGRVAELANQVRTNEANMNTVKQEAEKKAKNLEEQLSMKVRLLNQEQGMRKLRDNRIKDLGEQMKKMEEQLREEEKKVKTAAATASAAAAEQQQAKAQTNSATQTAGVAVSSAQPTTSRVVRDKRNIELLQGSAKILQEYRIQLSKALVALKKSAEGSQPAAAAAAATGVGAQKRKHPEQEDPEEGGGTAGGPSSKISRVEKQEQPGESGGSASSSSSSSSATEVAVATATTATTAPEPTTTTTDAAEEEKSGEDHLPPPPPPSTSE
ncbi:hypothetical protein FOZ63_004786 [Perkinsus olseni]|uniref:Nucleoprotein TPR n=1 Tax=Perkinsus olseni TaxID=32597 RepID=A0A7J6RXP1_PEROL|nr:hypothetical protein FOZ63_004786 [Perkinsus olseni]